METLEFNVDASANNIRIDRYLADQCPEHSRSYIQKLLPQSLNEELTRDDSCIRTIRSLIDAEDAMQFKTVDEQFEVIDSNTVSAVVDEMLVKAITFGKGDWRQLQRKSVSIRREKIQSWNLKEIAKGVYQWTLRYDSFLGYMHGVLDTEKAKIATLLL